jgi:hypothetical protein
VGERKEGREEVSTTLSLNEKKREEFDCEEDRALLA